MKITGGIISAADRTCGNCDLSGKCLFDQRRMGGFKGTSPHYIGYRIITDSIERNGAKEDTCTCFNFVETLQDRMLIGRSLIDAGKDGERIKVIAQEGQAIERRIRVGFNSLGEIVRPQAEIVEDLRRSGHKVSTADHSVPVNWREVTFRTTVPKYEEVIARVTEYGQTIMARELAEESAVDDAEDNAWEAAQRKMREDDAREAEVSAELIGAPVAEPIRRGPGRPPKDRTEP